MLLSLAVWVHILSNVTDFIWRESSEDITDDNRHSSVLLSDTGARMVARSSVGGDSVIASVESGCYVIDEDHFHGIASRMPGYQAPFPFAERCLMPGT